MNNFPSHSEYSGAHLFNETDGKLPIDQNDIEQIVGVIEQNETVNIEWAEIVFVDEKQILEINNNHLSHNYVTDIITFSYVENGNKNIIEGTLYCCAPRIKQQAKENSQSIKKEFWRVVVHGFLHLCGYNDKTDTEQKEMCKRENFYLTKLVS